jgi:hypothetical protein
MPSAFSFEDDLCSAKRSVQALLKGRYLQFPY